MRKKQIKNAVERAKDEFMPVAIQEVAMARAREEAWSAVAKPIEARVVPAPEIAEPTSPANAHRVRPTETKGNKVFSPSDPRITGYGP